MPIEVIYIFLLSGVVSAIGVPLFYRAIIEECYGETKPIFVKDAVKWFFIGLIPSVGIIAAVLLLAVFASYVLDKLLESINNSTGSAKKLVEFFKRILNMKIKD